MAYSHALIVLGSGMTSHPSDKPIRLNHELSGYPPYQPDRREGILEGAEITITTYKHNLTDSLVAWGGLPLIVNGDDLITFTDVGN
jgi:hypothetical protein